MKFVKSFNDYHKVSEGLRDHIENGLDLTDNYGKELNVNKSSKYYIE